MKKIFNDDQQWEYSMFVRKQVKESVFYQYEIGEMLNITKDAVSKALSLNNAESSRYNGTRRNILKALGFEVGTIVTKEG